MLFFGILVNYGFGLNVPKQLALLQNDTKEKQRVINEVIVTRLIICFFLTFLLYISTQYLGLFPGYSTILLFSSIQLLNDAVFPMFILQGFDRLSWISKANAISKAIYALLVVLVVQEAADAKWVNFILGGSGALMHGVLLVFIYRAECIRFYWVRLKRVKSRIVENYLFFSSTIASYVLVNGGFMLLSNFVSNAELGFYALAQRVSILLRMVPVFVTQSVLQNATRLYTEDRNAYASYMRKSYLNGLLITFGIGVFFAVLAPWVVRFLAGEFIPLSTSLMRTLCFLPFLGMLNIPSVIKIIITEEKQILARAIWITTILMLILGTLASYFYGSLGLAWSLVISELFNYWIHKYLLKKSEVSQ